MIRHTKTCGESILLFSNSNILFLFSFLSSRLGFDLVLDLDAAAALCLNKCETLSESRLGSKMPPLTFTPTFSLVSLLRCKILPFSPHPFLFAFICFPVKGRTESRALCSPIRDKVLSFPIMPALPTSSGLSSDSDFQSNEMKILLFLVSLLQVNTLYCQMVTCTSLLWTLPMGSKTLPAELYTSSLMRLVRAQLLELSLEVSRTNIYSINSSRFGFTYYFSYSYF